MKKIFVQLHLQPVSVSVSVSVINSARKYLICLPFLILVASALTELWSNPIFSTISNTNPYLWFISAVQFNILWGQEKKSQQAFYFVLRFVFTFAERMGFFECNFTLKTVYTEGHVFECCSVKTWFFHLHNQWIK